MLRTGLLGTLRARLAVLAVVLVVVGAFVALALWSGDDEGTPGVAGPETSTAGLSGECATTHAGHHIMAWDSTMADEMVELDCPWPYEPFLVSTEGGEEDPALEAPFEPHRYQELSDVVGQADLGICTLASVADEPGDGFVFGFRYESSEPGCPTATSTVDLVAREYVTKAHRDAAAHAVEDGSSLVLGRWVLQVVGDDAAQRETLVAALVAEGAEPVAPT